MLYDSLVKYRLDIYNFAPAKYQREGDKLVYTLQSPQDEVFQIWKRLRNIVSESGYWPIIGWDRFKIPPWQEDSTANILREADELHVPYWFHENGIDSIKEHLVKLNPNKASIFALDHFIHLGRFTNTPNHLVPIALIPVTNSWQIPAYLRLPDDSQSPHIHVAILKYWHEIYNVEIVAMNSAGIEVNVKDPPVTFEEAFMLAKQQYLYCPDIVTQGTGSITALAYQLLNWPIWRFWWD